MKRCLLFMVLISNVVFGQLIFTYKDIVGDDNGPGMYTYPLDPIFETGSFDLKTFSIYLEEDNYVFVFEVDSNFKNNWKNKNGWDIQMFDVYLNFDEGRYTQAVAGRNVKFNDGWDKVIVVSPEDNEKIWEKEIRGKNEFVGDDIYNPENILDGIITPEIFEIKENKLFAKVNKDKLKDMRKLTAIQVFVMGTDAYPDALYTYVRKVNEFNSQWRFGGGSDYFGNPNVIDMLGDNSSLGNYLSTEDESVYPIIDMIKLSKKNKKVIEKKF